MILTVGVLYIRWAGYASFMLNRWAGVYKYKNSEQPGGRDTTAYNLITCYVVNNHVGD